MLAASLAAVSSLHVPIGTSQHIGQRHGAPVMWDYAKQFAEQQEAQRQARMRRMQAEAAAEEAEANGPVKAKAGFTGGIQEQDLPKMLNFDEKVTSTWESSDVPDFLPVHGSSEAEKFADLMAIQFSEGIRGSQHDGDDIASREAARSPEMQINADPTLVFMPADEDCDAECQLETFGPRDFVLPAPKFNPKTMTETSIDDEYDMFIIGSETKKLTIDVSPVAMGFEDFYCGFTSDSHSAFHVTDNAFGKMERRHGTPTTVEVTVDPKGVKGQLVGHLCFIQPEEKDFSTFYEIRCDVK